MAKPSSLSRHISPPPVRRKPSKANISDLKNDDHIAHYGVSEERQGHTHPSLAAIEAGQAEIRNYLTYFSKHLEQSIRPAATPGLGIGDFVSLYERNQHEHGRQFVVHQHDHPISGVHYDLRLQFSGSSSLSFAVPYGLPGNPNSVRPNRMAVETRVHNLWNHLIESASHATGSLLIWDTGEYEVLPWREIKARSTDDELPDEQTFQEPSQSERLRASFQRRRIRLRLHGSKLPPNYTISMWLTSSNDRDDQPRKPRRKRRRVDPTTAKTKADATRSGARTSSDNDDSDTAGNASQQLGPTQEAEDEHAAAIASDDDEDATIRATNAYPGASNTIGSVHQRNWFLTLDRRKSGFRKARDGAEGGRWVEGFEPFFVMGRERERSVVTGRSADEVMEDEGVEKFVGRKMWLPILK